MSDTYELLRVRGLPVKLHKSFLLLMAVVVILALAGGGGEDRVVARILAPLLLFLAVVIHEFGHAAVALGLGIPVLDIVLTPFGGMARLVGAIEKPRHEIAVAAAGPVANLLVAAAGQGLLFALGAGALPAFDIFLEIEFGKSLGPRDWLMIFTTFNLLLGTVNFVPAFPMDGGRILRAALALRVGMLEATRFACRAGFWIAVLLLISPAFTTGVQWWILPFVGLFLIISGLRERLQIERDHFLRSSSYVLRVFSSGRADGDAGAPAPPAEPRLGGAPRKIIDASGESRVIED